MAQWGQRVYIVETEDGKQQRRHENLLRKRVEMEFGFPLAVAQQEAEKDTDEGSVYEDAGDNGEVNEMETAPDRRSTILRKQTSFYNP